MKKKLCLSVLVPVLMIFNSCIGMSMDIQMNKDGSGRVIMEYRISQILGNLGSSDGNESRTAIPLSKEDWIKTIESNNGLKFVSYSSKTEKQDTVIKIAIDFENEKALLSLLDPIGERVSIKRQDNSGTIEFIIIDDHFLDEYDVNDEYVTDIARMMLNGYNFSVSFKAPGNSQLTITDGKGNSVTSPASSQSVTSGSKVSFDMGMADFFDLKDGIGLKFTW